MKNVKKLVCLALALIFVLTLAACGATTEREFGRSEKDGREEGNRPATGMIGNLFGGNESSTETVAPEGPVALPTEPAETAATTEPAETAATTEPQGPQLICAMYDMVGETVASQLYFYNNSTFAMIVNLFEGYGSFYGTYYCDPDGIYFCTVTGKDFSGFYGEQLSSFSMHPSEGRYVIFLHNVDYVGLMNASDFFYVGG